MNEILHTTEYDEIIKRIERKRNLIVVFTIIAVFLTIFFCSPSEIYYLGEKINAFKGVNPVITVVLVLLILIAEVILYNAVSNPLKRSMDIEADPRKHLVLNFRLNKLKNKDNIFSTDLLYLGVFDLAIIYANKLIESNKLPQKLLGYFNRARCEFLLGDVESLKSTFELYNNILEENPKLIQHPESLCLEFKKHIMLLIAISENDIEKIKELKDIKVWNKSKATEGYINYLNGLIACETQDNKSANSFFTLVIDNCSKTVFAKMSQQYLSNLI